MIYILQSRWVSVYLESEKSGLNSVQLCCFSGICNTPRCRQHESSLNPDPRFCTLHLVMYIIRLSTWASLRRLGPMNFLPALCLHGLSCQSPPTLFKLDLRDTIMRSVAAATDAAILPHDTVARIVSIPHDRTHPYGPWDSLPWREICIMFSTI